MSMRVIDEGGKGARWVHQPVERHLRSVRNVVTDREITAVGHQGTSVDVEIYFGDPRIRRPDWKGSYQLVSDIFDVVQRGLKLSVLISDNRRMLTGIFDPRSGYSIASLALAHWYTTGPQK